MSPSTHQNPGWPYFLDLRTPQCLFEDWSMQRPLVSRRPGQQGPLGTEASRAAALRMTLLWEPGDVLGEALGAPSPTPVTQALPP